MEYITAKQAGTKWGISERRVQFLCTQGKIEGVKRFGWVWIIPDSAVKPKDGRRKLIK